MEPRLAPRFDSAPPLAAQGGDRGGLRPSSTPVDPRVRRLTLLASLLLHATGVGAGVVVLTRTTAPPEAAVVAAVELARVEDPYQTIELELPAMGPVGTVMVPGTSSAVATTPLPPGGERTPRPDLDQAGRGGTVTSVAPAMNLANHDDGILLSKDGLSNLERDQMQRLDTARDRASPEDRRATWKPMELTFLVTGSGQRAERRALADHDPAQGAKAASVPATAGGTRGAMPQPAGEGETAREAGQREAGQAARSAPAQGVRDGQPGDEHREQADAMLARPSVTEARPAVAAATVDRARDNVDSDQAVSSLVQSLLHASTAGGKPGEGPGGSAGPGRPGSGGVAGPGSTARAAGQGPGSGDVASDPTVGAYRRLVESRMQALWGGAFPRDAVAEGRQGVVIVGFTILATGAIQNIFLARPSGVDAFDAIALGVVRRTSLPPLPPVLGASRAWRMSFDAKNPAVR